MQEQINVSEDLLKLWLSNKQNDDVKIYSWLRQMDLCRLQVSEFVPPPVFMYYVAHVFGLPLAIIAFDHSELKLLKYFSVPSQQSDAMLSRKF